MMAEPSAGEPRRPASVARMRSRWAASPGSSTSGRARSTSASAASRRPASSDAWAAPLQAPAPRAGGARRAPRPARRPRPRWPARRVPRPAPRRPRARRRGSRRRDRPPPRGATTALTGSLTHGGERLVGLAALGCASPRGRPRSARADGGRSTRAVDAHEALALGLVEVRERQPEALGGALRQWRGRPRRRRPPAAAGGARRRAARPRAIRRRPRPRRAPAAGRRSARRPSSCAVAERRGELEQRERVAVRGPQEAIDDVGSHGAIQPGAEQGVGMLRVEAAHLELGEPRRVEVARARRRGPPSAARSARPGSAARRRRAPRPTAGRATARRRRSTARGRRRRPRRAGSAAPAETRKRSCTPSKLRPSAPRSAAAWGAGSRSRSSRHGRTSWCMPANGSSYSASMPTQRSTRHVPCACRRRTPAAPSCRCRARRAARAPRCARRVRCRSSASRADCSDSRPTSISSPILAPAAVGMRLGGGLGGHPIRALGARP